MSEKHFGSAGVTHQGNNFDFVRWVAASMVLASHEYAVLGRGGEEPLARLTNGSVTLGTLGVDIFFIVSGFLVTGSLVRSGDLVYYAASRALRILPGLVVALLFTVLIVGPLATTLPLAEYLSDPNTWHYVSRGIMLRDLQWTLPGVFTALPAQGIVNGSLWTLWPEVRMYAVVAGLGVAAWLLRTSRRGTFTVGMVAVAGIGLLRHADLAAQHVVSAPVARLALFFALGALFNLRAWRYGPGWVAFVLAAVAAIALRQSSLFMPLFDAAIVLGVLGIAFAPLGPLRNWARFGDWSYGMYLYAFPVQQAVALFLPELPLPAHFCCAYVITSALAATSWHVVEAPALVLKQMIARRPHRPMDRLTGWWGASPKPPDLLTTGSTDAVRPSCSSDKPRELALHSDKGRASTLK